MTLLLAAAMATAMPLVAESHSHSRDRHPSGFNILGYLPNIPLNITGAGVYLCHTPQLSLT
jgi:hypothetical protein